MELTASAQWLNQFFFGYDSAILGALHSLADSAGTVLTPLMKLITLLGEKGLIFFILAVVFACPHQGPGSVYIRGSMLRSPYYKYHPEGHHSQAKTL